ncbi:plant basic secretory protein [Paxillus ammoniavirescens]|nr:plant basic secretory protein [Paxillus ammoniavirescens]
MPPPRRLPAILPAWHIPNLLLRVEDLDHKGATIFFENANPREALNTAVEASYTWLYTPLTAPTHVKSITLVLRSFEGVAYTFGSHTDKEIHFSLDYIASSASRARDEILGVLVHEVVHCYQYNGKDTCPGGLIEGIADFVRLKAGYVPPHWKPVGGNRWDAGYDATAYFLDWIEKRCGKGTIRNLNAYMKESNFDETIFTTVAGSSVDTLWNLYCEDLERRSKHNGQSK